jgi:hypothetical protein
MSAYLAEDLSKQTLYVGRVDLVHDTVDGLFKGLQEMVCISVLGLR